MFLISTRPCISLMPLSCLYLSPYLLPLWASSFITADLYLLSFFSVSPFSEEPHTVPEIMHVSFACLHRLPVSVSGRLLA